MKAEKILENLNVLLNDKVENLREETLDLIKNERYIDVVENGHWIECLKFVKKEILDLEK